MVATLGLLVSPVIYWLLLGLVVMITVLPVLQAPPLLSVYGQNLCIQQHEDL